MSVEIYVEGGGDNKALRRECRQAFSRFFESCDLKGRMPAVVACGGRNDVYDRFCTAVRIGDGSHSILLVDSETAVTNAAWEHLQQQDRWNKPRGTTDDQAHLMVQCMEAWFLADRATLKECFGAGFQSGSLPRNKNVEQVAKTTLLDKLAEASRRTKKERYDKGRHSFEILGRLDPKKVAGASKHARRLLEVLHDKCG